MSGYAGRHRDAVTRCPGAQVAPAGVGGRRRRRGLACSSRGRGGGGRPRPVRHPTIAGRDGAATGPPSPTVPPEAGLQMLGRQGDLADLAEQRRGGRPGPSTAIAPTDPPTRVVRDGARESPTSSADGHGALVAPAATRPRPERPAGRPARHRRRRLGRHPAPRARRARATATDSTRTVARGMLRSSGSPTASSAVSTRCGTGSTSGGTGRRSAPAWRTSSPATAPPVPRGTTSGRPARVPERPSTSIWRRPPGLARCSRSGLGWVTPGGGRGRRMTRYAGRHRAATPLGRPGARVLPRPRRSSCRTAAGHAPTASPRSRRSRAARATGAVVALSLLAVGTVDLVTHHGRRSRRAGQRRAAGAPARRGAPGGRLPGRRRGPVRPPRRGP